MTRLILPDTNLFFECKALEQLPWSELGDGPFVILLTKPVLDEIDEHKKSGNRTRRRAVEIFGRIREMLRAKVQEECVETEGAEVSLRLAGRLSVGNEPLDGLNLSKNDDRLIAILSELVANGEDAFLLTHDTGPASTAEGYGLPFYLIPDHWLRPAEATPEEKQVKALESELTAYRQSEPILALQLAGRSERTPTVTRALEVLTPLDDEDITAAIEALKTAHPLKTDYSDPPKAPPVLKAGSVILSDSIRYEAPSQDDQQVYKEKTYPAWLDACRAVFASLHRVKRTTAPTSLIIELENEGSRPAHGVRITFEAQGGIWMKRPNRDEDDEETDSESNATTPEPDLPELPTPPKPPAWRTVIVEQTHSIPAVGSAAQSLADLARGNLLGLPKGVQAMLGADDRIRRMGLGDGGLHDRYVPTLPNLRIPSPHIPPPHDPEAFYYDHWRPSVPVSSGALTCDRLRHQNGTETFEVEVLFQDGAAINASILCRVHADNLTQPASLRIRIEQTVQERKPIEELQEVLRRAGAE
ncbi:MAG: PIN domain-containing protein [Pseudomonadota bacterium]